MVVCPGLNDGDVLEATLAGVLDRYPELASLCVVPLGVSRYNTEPRMRAHTVAEAAAVVDCVEAWQQIYLDTLGRRLVYVGDEYYLLAERAFPGAEAYDDFAMHEDGVGMARTLEQELFGEKADATGKQDGFFAWADASGSSDADYEPYRGHPGDRGPAAAGAPVTQGPGRHPHRAPTALACWSRSCAASGAPTCDSCRSTTSSSGAPRRSPACWWGRTSPASWPPSPKAIATSSRTCASPTGASSTAPRPRTCRGPVEIIPTDGHALRAALSPA